MEIKPVYLVMVDAGGNNNKFYRMIPGASNFTVEYGRVGNPSFQTTSYPISLWDKKYNEKIKKGYVDQTRLMAVFKEKAKKEFLPISDEKIAQIVTRLQEMANQAIRDNYTISSDRVSISMINEAQDLLNALSLNVSVGQFNDVLMKLFKTIPRKMANVSNSLARTEKDFENIFQKEQDLLDVMRGKVVEETEVTEESQEENEPLTILDKMGLMMYNPSISEIQAIKKNLGEISDKFYCAWGIKNKNTQTEFDKYVNNPSFLGKEVKMLWHGSRNENWWSIINSGLVLRPNAVITGKMFGDGIYFAPSAKKSFGYTSYSGSYWAGGKSKTAFMSLFDVAYGKPYNVYSHDSEVSRMNYDKLKIKGDYNSLHAHAGNMLRNDEIIVYKESQITIRYLVELR